MKLTYPAVFTPFGDRSGYTVTIPDLPGCVTEGNDLADALIMAHDAACGWVLDELEDGNPAPVPSALSDITLDNGEFTSFLALDIDKYADKFGNKAVRKNVTIPAWLNTFGESHNLNFSSVLQAALQEIYRNS